MGTDIHAVFQAKRNGKWVDIRSEYDERRHYMLFAWLADVRNGFGFAGVPTHDPVRPISKPRGLPRGMTEDHETTDEVYASNWRSRFRDEDDQKNVIWLGDHSWSWLTADEILAATVPAVLRTGIVEMELFKNWDGVSEPERSFGGISGPRVVVSTPDTITKKTSHVRIEWMSSASDFDYFLDEIRRLKTEHGEVRMVFGFDS